MGEITLDMGVRLVHQYSAHHSFTDDEATGTVSMINGNVITVKFRDGTVQTFFREHFWSQFNATGR